jgi:hypothetical protein
MIVQKLNREIKGKIELAIRYYAILSALNNLRLTPKQLELLAFTAFRGTITPQPAREEFAQMFNSSADSVENLKGQLVKKGLLIKQNGMYKVRPEIDLGFDQDVVLQIKLGYAGE